MDMENSLIYIKAELEWEFGFIQQFVSLAFVLFWLEAGDR